MVLLVKQGRPTTSEVTTCTTQMLTWRAFTRVEELSKKTLEAESGRAAQ